ncbi:MAG: type II toxin-antitoxin system RelE/ParE family toxin [Dehalococcoidia bacterium]|nr:type II toxin-antitoxin system RelE/ParE family toxin [Dehalococcoidia bacterium]
MQVIITPRAKKDLEGLDRNVASRVIQALQRYAETGHGNLKRLHSAGRELRLRVGDWRVIAMLDNSTDILYVLRVRNRREAYRE